MGPARLALLALLLTSACRQRTALDLATADGDLVILAIASGGEIRSVETLVVGPDPLERLALGPEEATHAFVLPSGSLVTPAGSPLTGEQLAGARASAPGASVSGGGAGGGSCGRCLDQSIAPPMIVFPGDRCAIPPFARGQVDPGAGELAPETELHVREAIRLEWPGDCPCSAARPTEGPPIALEVIEPAPGFWPPQIVAATGLGDVGVFSGVNIRTIAPDGRSLELPVPLSEGPLLAAAGLIEGGYLAAHSDPVEKKAARLELLARDLSTIAVLDNLATRVEAIVPAATVDRGVLVAGQRDPVHPSLLTCAYDAADARFGCEELIPLELRTIDRSLDFSAMLPDGTVVGVGDRSGFFQLERLVRAAGFRSTRITGTDASSSEGVVEETGLAPARWRWSPIVSGAAPADADAIGAIGQRVFVCISDDADTGSPAHAVVLSATVTGASPPRWRDSGCSFPASCRAFSPAPGRPDRILEHFSGDRLATFDADGAIVADGRNPPCDPGMDPAHAELGRVIARVVSPRPEVTLIVDAGGSIFRRSNTATTAPLVQVYGPAAPADTRAGAITAVGEDFYTFGAGGGGARIEPGEPPRITRFVVPGLQPDAWAVGAVPDPLDETVLVALNDPRPRLLRFRPADLGAEAIELPAELLPPSDRLVDLAALVPGVFVLVLERGQLVRYDRRAGADRFTPIPIAWDDPATVELEDPPPPPDEACKRRRPTDPRFDERDPAELFRAIDSTAGIATVVGCRGTVLRVRPFTSAERVSFHRPGQTLFVPGRDAPPSLTAVKSLCTDRVILGAEGTNDLTDQEGRLWSIAPAPAGAANAPADGRVFEEVSRQSASPSQLFGSSPGDPLAMLGDARGLLGVYWHNEGGAVLELGRSERLLISDPFVAAAQTAEGRILLSTLQGRLLAGRLR